MADVDKNFIVSWSEPLLSIPCCARICANLPMQDIASPLHTTTGSRPSHVDILVPRDETLRF
jgi:hypothetical protein